MMITIQIIQRLYVNQIGARTGWEMKTENAPWDVGRGWSCHRGINAFWWGAWHTFIISSTFTRGRSSCGRGWCWLEVWDKVVIGYWLGCEGKGYSASCSSVCTDWPRCTCPTTASLWLTPLAINTCNQPTLWVPWAWTTYGDGALLSADQSCGTVYLWLWDQVTLQRTLPEDISRHLSLAVLTIS